MHRDDLQQRLHDLLHVILPSLGRTRGWVVHEPHCFTRIVLDHLFADCWYNHLEHRLHAHRQLNDTQLAQAVALADRMRDYDSATIEQMNAQSLAWREQPGLFFVRHPIRHRAEY